MSIATVCLLVACVLPIVCAGLAKREGLATGTFDNRHPRAWLAAREGAAARANAAQMNSWEALPIFLGGVLHAELHHAPAAYVDALAGAFIACRVVYIALYVGDRASFRSVVWSGGLVASLALYVLGAA